MAHAIRPGYEDARLLVHLAEWHSDVGLSGALRWLWSEDRVTDHAVFAVLHPPGSDGDGIIATVCDYFETVGALHKHGLLNEELLFDWLPVSRVWDRVREYVLAQRRSGETGAWANFEALAAAHKRALGEYAT